MRARLPGLRKKNGRFTSNSTAPLCRLKQKARLDTLANVLKSDQSVKEAKIVGYADRIGSVSYNEQLSQKRAETVRDYLIAHRIHECARYRNALGWKIRAFHQLPRQEARSQLIALPA